MKIGMFRIFRCFSKIWNTEERYKAERIGESAEPCPTPTLMLKIGENEIVPTVFGFSSY